MMSTTIHKETPHIKPKGVEIAETILLPGDPLRAKFIAETYLENAVQFNSVRNMFGYTGTYKGKKISVMGTGMGMPSMSLYSWELIHVFGVKNLIRIGTCGAMQEHMNLYDIVFAMGASTDSRYVHQFNLPGEFSNIASFALLEKAKKQLIKNVFLYMLEMSLRAIFFTMRMKQPWKSGVKWGFYVRKWRRLVFI